MNPVTGLEVSPNGDTLVFNPPAGGAPHGMEVIVVDSAVLIEGKKHEPTLGVKLDKVDASQSCSIGLAGMEWRGENYPLKPGGKYHVYVTVLGGKVGNEMRADSELATISFFMSSTLASIIQVQYEMDRFEKELKKKYGEDDVRRLISENDLAISEGFDEQVKKLANGEIAGSETIKKLQEQVKSLKDTIEAIKKAPAARSSTNSTCFTPAEVLGAQQNWRWALAVACILGLAIIAGLLMSNYWSHYSSAPAPQPTWAGVWGGTMGTNDIPIGSTFATSGCSTNGVGAVQAFNNTGTISSNNNCNFGIKVYVLPPPVVKVPCPVQFQKNETQCAPEPTPPPAPKQAVLQGTDSGDQSEECQEIISEDLSQAPLPSTQVICSSETRPIVGVGIELQSYADYNHSIGWNGGWDDDHHRRNCYPPVRRWPAYNPIPLPPVQPVGVVCLDGNYQGNYGNVGIVKARNNPRMVVASNVSRRQVGGKHR